MDKSLWRIFGLQHDIRSFDWMGLRCVESSMIKLAIWCGGKPDGPLRNELEAQAKHLAIAPTANMFCHTSKHEQQIYSSLWTIKKNESSNFAQLALTLREVFKHNGTNSATQILNSHDHMAVRECVYAQHSHQTVVSLTALMVPVWAYGTSMTSKMMNEIILTCWTFWNHTFVNRWNWRSR